MTAAVFLTVIQKVFAGRVPAHCEGFPDLHPGERLALAIVSTYDLTVQLLEARLREGTASRLDMERLLSERAAVLELTVA